MANVPSGYVYYDSSKEKDIAAGNAMPTIGDGDQLNATSANTDGYDYVYDKNIGGWYATSVWTTQTGYEELMETINGKPLVSLEYCWSGSNKMVTAPTIPSSVTNMERAFASCSKLVEITIPSSVNNITGIFEDCTSLKIVTMNATPIYYSSWAVNTNPFILIGNGNNKSSLIAAARPVIVISDLAPRFSTFSTARCDSNGVLKTDGSYVKVTATILAPSNYTYFPSAKLYPPILQKDGSSISSTWHINSLSGTTVTSNGINLQTSTTLVTLYNNGPNSAAYSATVSTGWDNYFWEATSSISQLTGQTVLIDGYSGGSTASVGILAYAPSTSGVQIGGNTDVSGYVHATGDVKGNNIPDGTILTSSNYKTSYNVYDTLNINTQLNIKAGKEIYLYAPDNVSTHYTRLSCSWSSSAPWLTAPSVYQRQGSTANPAVRVTSDGRLYATETASSIRVKKEVEDIKDFNVEALYDISVKQFKYKDGFLGNDDPYYNKLLIGIIAEDVDDKFPVAATRDKDGLVSNYDDRTILIGLLKLVQNQHNEIENLKMKITALETR